MDKKDIKLILTNPHKDILDYILNTVNLTERELEAITLVDIKGKTEERASEQMNISLRNIQRTRVSAYNKLEKVWSNSSLVQLLLKMLKEE